MRRHLSGMIRACLLLPGLLYATTTLPRTHALAGRGVHIRGLMLALKLRVLYPGGSCCALQGVCWGVVSV